MLRTVQSLGLFAILLTLAGCPKDTVATDASVSTDSRVPDTSVGDGSTPDATTPTDGGRDSGTVACATQGPEDTMAACTDGCDNDGNNFADCRDRSCSAFCTVERSAVTCTDGMDNDGNGFTDCADFSCRNTNNMTGLNVCLREMNNVSCSDGMDNDGDNMMDCADTDCQNEAIVVCNGTTASGLAAAMWPAAIMTRCSDRMDNNNNMFTDCADSSCQVFHAACRTAGYEGGNAACRDGMDNDGDGLMDCADPDCAAATHEAIVVCNAENMPVSFATEAAVTTAANTRCLDSMNNDGNMTTAGAPIQDCGDFSCSRDSLVTACDATSEGNVRTCADTMNNDGNMNAMGMAFTDCGDFACSQNPDPAICASLERGGAECSDGMDNDRNGFADCNDNACTNHAVCSGMLRTAN